MSGKRLAFHRVTVTDQAWTPLYPKFDCDYISVRNIQVDATSNGVLVRLRTDEADEDSEVPLLPGGTDTVQSSASTSVVSDGTYRFSTTAPMLFARAQTKEGVNPTVTTLTIVSVK